MLIEYSPPSSIHTVRLDTDEEELNPVPDPHIPILLPMSSTYFDIEEKAKKASEDLLHDLIGTPEHGSNSQFCAVSPSPVFDQSISKTQDPLKPTACSSAHTSVLPAEISTPWHQKIEQQISRNTSEIQKVLVGLELLQQEQRKEATRNWERYNLLMQKFSSATDSLPVLPPPQFGDDVPKPAYSSPSPSQ